MKFTKACSFTGSVDNFATFPEIFVLFIINPFPGPFVYRKLWECFSAVYENNNVSYVHRKHIRLLAEQGMSLRTK